MNQWLKARLRAWLLAATLPGVVFAGAIACDGDEDDVVSETLTVTVPATTETPGNETPTQANGDDETASPTEANDDDETPSPTAGAGNGDDDRRTGVDEVDEIIDAIEEGDLDTVEGAVVMFETECTEQQGAGGPPQCRGDESEGDTISVFPVVGCQGEHLRGDLVRSYMDRQFTDQDAELYAVVEYTGEPESELFPTGDYGAIFDLGDGGAMFGISEDGDVVTFVTLCDASAEQILDAQTDADVVVEPEQ